MKFLFDFSEIKLNIFSKCYDGINYIEFYYIKFLMFRQKP